MSARPCFGSNFDKSLSKPSTRYIHVTTEHVTRDQNQQGWFIPKSVSPKRMGNQQELQEAQVDGCFLWDPKKCHFSLRRTFTTGRFVPTELHSPESLDYSSLYSLVCWYLIILSKKKWFWSPFHKHLFAIQATANLSVQLCTSVGFINNCPRSFASEINQTADIESGNSLRTAHTTLWETLRRFP